MTSPIPCWFALLVIATVNKLPSEVVASVFAYALGLAAVVTAFVVWQGRRAR